MIIFSKGFTLIELTVVLLVVGILAAFAAPTFNLSGYREQGFIQQSLAAIRYAQKQAMGSGCHVQVNITAASCFLTWTGAPAGFSCPVTALTNPANSSANFCQDSDAPPGSTFAPAFVFDKIGRPSAGTLQYVLGTTTIQVESETGYAHKL
jgi:MSHA pilin protein MshC